MSTPIEEVLSQALKSYHEWLDTQPIREQSIGHRKRGAEDFVHFLIGKKRKNERIVNRLLKR